MPEFASVLDIPQEDIKAPVPLPVGSYVTVVKGQPRIDKSKNKGTEFSEFTLQVLSALNDVNPDKLAEISNLTDKTLRITFYHTPDSIYRLKNFLEHCGVDMEPGANLRQLIAEAPGCQVIAHVVHEPSDDGSAVYSRVKNTTAVE